MPRTGPMDSEDNASMKSARSNFQPPASGPRSDKVEPSAHPQIGPGGLKAQEEVLTDQEGAAPLDLVASSKVLMIGRRSEPSDRN